MRTTPLLKVVFLTCIAVLFELTLGCGSDPVQPLLTETEKKLAANSWHGVWHMNFVPNTTVILYEEITFKSDKSCDIKSCNTHETKNWTVADSAGKSYISISSTRYTIETLTTDTLLIREPTTSGKTYLFLKNFTGYNNIKITRTYENGVQGETIGTKCGVEQKPEIPDYNFSAECYPNPASFNTMLNLGIATKGTSVKITLDDGQSVSDTVLDEVLPAGQNSFLLDVQPKKSGVYKLTYTVKPPNATVAKTTYSYIFVFTL